MSTFVIPTRQIKQKIFTGEDLLRFARMLSYGAVVRETGDVIKLRDDLLKVVESSFQDPSQTLYYDLLVGSGSDFSIVRWIIDNFGKFTGLLDVYTELKQKEWSPSLKLVTTDNHFIVLTCSFDNTDLNGDACFDYLVDKVGGFMNKPS